VATGGGVQSDRPHRRLRGWLVDTKETLGAVVAIIVAVLALVHWGGDIVGWVRGDDGSPTPPQQGTLAVEEAHIVTKPNASFARFSTSGQADGVDGKHCFLRWQTYDAGNDQPLEGPGQSGARAIGLDHHVCLANQEFDIPAPGNVDSLYAEVVMQDESGNRLAPRARSKSLVIAHP
jgi:hypothetical protein